MESDDESIWVKNKNSTIEEKALSGENKVWVWITTFVVDLSSSFIAVCTLSFPFHLAKLPSLEFIFTYCPQRVTFTFLIPLTCTSSACLIAASYSRSWSVLTHAAPYLTLQLGMLMVCNVEDQGLCIKYTPTPNLRSYKL